MIPSPNALAILRTCRQIKEEAGALWLGHILFNFENPEFLLDKLSTLPSATLSKIRHIRTGARLMTLLPVRLDSFYSVAHYRLVWALKLLPGLCLDKLTVPGPTYGSLAYETLEELIKYGNGWRELHFITRDSAMLGITNNHMPKHQPKPQPSTWNEILCQRDGANSGASVTIYRSTRPGWTGTVINSRTRQIFEQKASFPADLEIFAVTKDRELSQEMGNRELLVIAKRGRSANIAEQDRPPYMLNDIRQWAHGMTWTQIRRHNTKLSEPIRRNLYCVGVQVDNYREVDEYEWTHVN
jgi:hypothetical protein